MGDIDNDQKIATDVSGRQRLGLSRDGSWIAFSVDARQLFGDARPWREVPGVPDD
jgi:hypothetical protein